MSAPLVSVIVPTRDRPERLAVALASVVAQSHPAVECIVVNDGGVDVAGVVAMHDQRGITTYLRLPARRHPSAARNAGLALACGEFVAYLDDDDWYDPHHLATLVAACEREGRGVAFSLARRVIERRCDGRYRVVAVEEPPAAPFDPSRLLVEPCIPLATLLHRRDRLDAAGVFDETLPVHEDWDFTLRLARHDAFAQVPEATCSITRRDDGSSITSARPDDFVRTRAIIYERLAAERARHPAVATAHAEFFRTLRRARGQRPLRASLVVAIADGHAPQAGRCLAAIAAHTDGVDFDVVVVDDASRNAGDLLAALGGDVVVLHNSAPRGLAAAWNQGAAAAGGDVLVFLHADVEPLAGWLLALLDEFEEDPAVVAAGPLLLRADGRIGAAGLVFPRGTPSLPYPLYRGLGADTGPALVRARRRALPGACLAVRGAAFLAAGGFAPDDLGGLEDADLCLRVAESGGAVVYQPRSVVRHGEDDPPPPDAAAGQARFAARWPSPLLADEDTAYLAAGLALRRQPGGGPATAVAVASVAERVRWERVAALQRAAEDGAAAAAALAAGPGEWPEDAAVLGWAATVCATLGLGDHAAAFRTRAAALGGPAEPCPP